jgi:uncharacterized membrane protein
MRPDERPTIAPGRRRRLDGPGTQPAPGPEANLSTVAKLEAEHLLARSLGERLGDTIGRLAGSGWFALGHVAWFGGWLAVNTAAVPGVPAFDPYPFPLLTLAVSLEAIFLSIFVLVSQNRMTRQADRRAHLDLQVNLLAEQEATATLRALHRISEHLGIPALPSAEEAKLEARTDIERIATEIDRTLPG